MYIATYLLHSCLLYIGPVHIMVTYNVSFTGGGFVITVSWQVRIYVEYYHYIVIQLFSHIQAPQFTNCAANIIMYNITVMDQYSPASVTVPPNMLSVELRQFLADNTISIAANREYNITVSAISDQGTSYPSDSIIVSKYS